MVRALRSFEATLEMELDRIPACLIAVQRLRSFLLSFNPLPNIRGTIFELYSLRFTTHQKRHCIPVGQSYFSQVKNDAAKICLEFQKLMQLRDVFCLKMAGQRQDAKSPPHRSLDLQGHRLSQAADIGVTVVTAYVLYDHRLNSNATFRPFATY
jgi:hypothetical protein